MLRSILALASLCFAASPALAFRADVSLLSDRFLVGEPTYVWLVLTNDAKETSYLLAQPNGLGLTVSDEQGQPVVYQGPMVDLSPAGLFDAYQPNEVRVLRFDLQSAYDLSRPGRYTVRFRYPTDSIDRIFEHGASDVPRKAAVRTVATADAGFTVVDPHDAVSDLIREERTKANHSIFGDVVLDLAPTILERFPESPYSSVARHAMVRRLLLGKDEFGLPMAERTRRASTLLAGIPTKDAPAHSRAYVAVYLLEKARACHDNEVVQTWLRALEKEFAGKAPAQAATKCAAAGR